MNHVNQDILWYYALEGTSLNPTHSVFMGWLLGVRHRPRNFRVYCVNDKVWEYSLGSKSLRVIALHNSCAMIILCIRCKQTDIPSKAHNVWLWCAKVDHSFVQNLVYYRIGGGGGLLNRSAVNLQQLAYKLVDVLEQLLA